MATQERHDDENKRTGTLSTSSSRHQDGLINLIPQPSTSPADPLNWSTIKKLSTLFIVTLAGFIGLAQTVAANSGYFIQAKLYGKTAVQLSYGVGA